MRFQPPSPVAKGALEFVDIDVDVLVAQNRSPAGTFGSSCERRFPYCHAFKNRLHQPCPTAEDPS